MNAARGHAERAERALLRAEDDLGALEAIAEAAVAIALALTEPKMPEPKVTRL